MIFPETLVLIDQELVSYGSDFILIYIDPLRYGTWAEIAFGTIQTD